MFRAAHWSDAIYDTAVLLAGALYVLMLPTTCDMSPLTPTVQSRISSQAVAMLTTGVDDLDASDDSSCAGNAIPH